MSLVQPLIMRKASEASALWPHIRPALEALLERQPDAWLPEHVFHEIMLGTSYLWTTPDLCGFVVLQVRVSPYARDLHVWIACNGTDARAGDFFPQLKAIAAEQDCTAVTFESGREGFGRAIPELEGRYLYQAPEVD